MKLTLICLLVSFVLLQYVEHSEACLEVIEHALGLEPCKEDARKEHHKVTHKEPNGRGPGLVRTTRSRVTLRPRHRVTRRIKRHTMEHHRTTRSIPVPPKEHTTHRMCTEPTNPPCTEKTTPPCSEITNEPTSRPCTEETTNRIPCTENTTEATNPPCTEKITTPCSKITTEPTSPPCTEKATPPCSEITTKPTTKATNPPCTEKTTTTPTTEEPCGCKSSHPPGWNPGGPIQTSPPKITKEPCGCKPNHPPGWNPGGPKIPIPNVPGHFGPGPVIPNGGGKGCGCPNECPPKEELGEDLRIIQDKIQLLLDGCILQSQSC
ncbi:salivary glue protein Sgs-3 [Drosophila subpulchrella]|uniref:salivary glue protein Sgs-3 n=1 Tax=Drosophila subpulchrella TaxID=1486046 RepID=UPI0018A192B2|nr:salivary glue protein Sgs-3 [Drosophila subpulchrella]